MMSQPRCRALAACALSLAFSTANANAHATLETKQAAVGDAIKAVMRIPHGCGALPTRKVRIRIPNGIVGVKPMPKPGWSLETVKGPYDKPYEVNHAKQTEGVREITWSGGELQNDWYDEFIFVGAIADTLAPGSTLWFPTVQECDGAAERWIEIPQDGAPANNLKFPAPGLKLLPKP
jgi:uncharacterized protein YcnI